LNAYVCDADNDAQLKIDLFSSQWVALTWKAENFSKLLQLGCRLKYTRHQTLRYRPWTDDYSTVLPFLKIGLLLSEVKHFEPFDWEFDFEQL
jgi:hypothetical protein